MSLWSEFEKLYHFKKGYLLKLINLSSDINFDLVNVTKGRVKLKIYLKKLLNDLKVTLKSFKRFFRHIFGLTLLFGSFTKSKLISDDTFSNFNKFPFLKWYSF